MSKKTIRDIDVKGKRVFVRVDFNVPMKDGVITDDTRIRATLPTIKYLLDNGAAVILAAHFGRPKGECVPKYSLEPIAKYLGGLLGMDVKFAADCVGPIAEAASAALKPGEVLLLENLRFHKEEEKNGAEFSAGLAKLADVVVNDAFGVSHRAHASVEGITKYIPSVAGFLMEKEIEFLGKVTHNPPHPYVAIIGGAKVSDKIGVIENLMGKVDTMIIGGGMANTFMAAQGYGVGKSLLEADKIDLAKSLIDSAAKGGAKLLLPVDVIVADKFAADAEWKAVALDAVPAEWMILDIGPKTADLYAAALTGAAAVCWNGPMGVFEMDNFAKGTFKVAEAVANCGAITVVGGGDSVAAIEKAGLADKITHISTGGGASLEFLEGKNLPGIAAIQDTCCGQCCCSK
ncbi:MAG: phosphoglycerate kinase [Bacillota bacterium]